MTPLRFLPLNGDLVHLLLVSFELSNAIEGPLHGDDHKTSLPGPETILLKDEGMELIAIFRIFIDLQVLFKE